MLPSGMGDSGQLPLGVRWKWLMMRVASSGLGRAAWMSARVQT